MSRGNGFFAGWVLCLMSAVGVGSGCDSSKSASRCQLGSERCECYGNGTCDDGLICRSERCVASASGSTNAAAGSSGQVGGLGGTSAAATGGAVTTIALAGATQLGSGGSAGTSQSAAGGTSPASTGGSATGGATTSSGGAAGSSSAGKAAGGSATGGNVSGGAGTGGNATSGSPSGGKATGGSPAGGGAAGGNSAGGTNSLAGAAGAATGPNLIIDGDFSSSVNGLNNYWAVDSSTPVTFVYGFIDGMFDIRPATGQSWTLSWPKNVVNAAAVELGARYLFSFRSRAVNGATIVAVVRSATDKTLRLTAITLTVSATWQTYSYVLFMPTGLPSGTPATIGVAFEGNETTTNNDVFFDDVGFARY